MVIFSEHACDIFAGASGACVMVVPDYPRLPPSYRVPSDQSYEWPFVIAELPQPSTGDGRRCELAVRLACALALGQHAGDNTYCIALERGASVIEGAIDLEAQTIASLLTAMHALKQPSSDPRLSFTTSSIPEQAQQATPLRVHADMTTSSTIKLRLTFDDALVPLMEAQWFLSHVTHYANQLLRLENDSLHASTIALRPRSEQQLLAQYTRSPTPLKAYPDDCTTLHSFVLHAAQEFPDHIALDFAYDDDSRLQLTFTELVLVSRHVAAHHILPITTGKAQVVPICIDKSPEMIIAMLAVLLAGAAYLNLEPAFPQARKQGILQELSHFGMLGRVALVQSTNDENTNWTSWDEVDEVIDPVMAAKEALSTVKQEGGVRSMTRMLDGVQWPCPSEHDPAYIIYTSGTTGKPKGICVEHCNVAAFLRNYRDVFGRAPGERVLQFPSYSFDVSVMNIWDTFAHGATLCMTTPSSLMSDLAGTILKLECTIVDLTPTVSSVLFELPETKPVGNETLEQAWRRAGFKVKWINTGGEKVEKWVRDAWIARGVTVVIDYGPTETTVGVISNQSRDLSPPIVPIGRPTGNTPVYILSPNSLEPVPLGCIGEICVGGHQVTRGYVRTELNAGVFVDGGDLGRMYRTGDLGRFLGDGFGSIECLGRKDGQVKVNGLRIEIGEIEEHLSAKAHPDIFRGVVDKFETPDIPASLVALIDLSESFKAKHGSARGQDGDNVHVLSCSMSAEFQAIVEQAKRHLSDSLPQYMVPRYWLPISRVPMQGMGKTDRKTLRQLAEQFDWRQARTQARRQPANGQESNGVAHKQTKDEWHDAVRLAWSKVVKTDVAEIYDDDSFTKLGGDSIGFLKVVSKLKEAGFSVHFRDLVEASTLTQCAGVLRKMASSSAKTDGRSRQYETFSLIGENQRELVLAEIQNTFSIAASDVEDVYPTAPSQDALLAASIDCTHYYAQAVYKLDATIDLENVKQAIIKMVERYAVLRSCFAVLDSAGTTCQIVLKARADSVQRAVTINVIESENLSGSIATWLEKDRNEHVFAWGKLALSFAIFQSLNSGERKLAWSMHHAMSDGWTLELLTADLRGLCHGLNVSERPPFSSVVKWWLKDSKIEPETAEYWHSYLIGAKPLSWPSTDVLGGQQLSTSTIQAVHWSGDLVGFSRRTGITPAIASRVAVAIALGRHANADDVTLGIVRSGRDIDVDFAAEEVIGPCVSVLPSRFRFDSFANSSLLDVLRHETQQDLQARSHQHITLSQLANVCQLEGGRADLFNILVTYQSLADRDDDAQSLSRHPFPIQQPPERITMPTSYTMSFEITPDANDKEKLELACFYDDRVVNEERVKQVLKDMARVMDYLTTAPCTKLPDIIFDTRIKIETPISIRHGEADDSNGDVDNQEVEQVIDMLRNVWASILRLDRDEFGPTDSFASLGGDSISMMKMSVRLAKENISIPVHRLVKLGTMSAQARWVVHNRETRAPL
ncbi:NRPS [Microbotryomycetes sp. JL201]|nr:NRPS [Microbotryomycetes sp. JL201]